MSRAITRRDGITGSIPPRWRDIGHGLSHDVGAAALAASVIACLLWTAGEEPLPCLGGAAAFLLLAVHQDVSHLRIPNWLTLPALCGALAFAFAQGGLSGLRFAAAGAGTALALTFVPFLVRWLGAGDVKACVVLGAFWGARGFVEVFWWMLIVGGALGLALLVLRGGLADLIGRWVECARSTLASRRLVAPAPGAATGIPFALVIGLAASAFQQWGMPW